MMRKNPWITRWREAIRDLRPNLAALYFAASEEGTPRSAIIIALALIAYGLSPIDIIPDLFPVIGYMDDLIIVPLGIWYATDLLPLRILYKSQRKARENPQVEKTLGYLGAATFVIIYALVALWFWGIYFRPPQ